MELIISMKIKNKRVMDEEYSEFFAPVNKCNYSLENSRRMLPNKPSKSNKNIKLPRRQNDSKIVRMTTSRPHTSKAKSSRRQYQNNAYSFQNTENSFDVDNNKSIHSQKPGTGDSKRRKLHTSRIAMTQGKAQKKMHSTFAHKNNERIYKVFKDMDINDLIKHEKGILNLHNELKKNQQGKL